MRYRRRDTQSKAGLVIAAARSSAGIGAVAILAGCMAVSTLPGEPATAPRAASTAGPAISQRLYFGRSIPGGGSVSEGEWNSFLAEVVTPRFPAGFTVWRAEGQWQGDDGVIVREATFVLEVIHAPVETAELAVREIVSEYRQRFQQEAVLRVRDEVRMFLEGS
jgi:hypothetical protein